MNSEFERHTLSKLVHIDQKSLGKKTPEGFTFSYISLSDVSSGNISKTLEKHSFKSAPSRARRVLQNGDIIMATVRPNLQGFAKITEEFSQCVASTGFAVLSPKDNVSGEFIYQCLYSYQITKQIESLVVGSNYPAINSSDVAGLHIYAPLYPEQRKIAKILSTWDKAISAIERLIDNSKQQKKALMQQLLTGKKRFAGFSKDWKQIHLGDIGKCITGLTYKPTDTVDDGVLVLRSSNIQNSKLAFEDNVFVSADLKVKSKTQENDILVCVRNGSKNLIGKSTLIKGRAVGQAHGAFMTLFRGKHPLYVSQLFQSSEFFRQVNMNLGATINSINTSDLHKFKFTIPTDEDEINAIASCLSNAENEIEILQQQVADLKLEKKALMQQLLTGKRRVTVN